MILVALVADGLEHHTPKGSIDFGTDTYWQCWIADAGGPAGFSASNGVLGTVQASGARGESGPTTSRVRARKAQVASLLGLPAT